MWESGDSLSEMQKEEDLQRWIMNRLHVVIRPAIWKRVTVSFWDFSSPKSQELEATPLQIRGGRSADAWKENVLWYQ
jgi:hypothetical protein